MKTRLLSQDMIKSLITMKDVVDVVEKTYHGMGEGTVINPAKVNLDLGETAEYPPYKGFMNAMPAFIGFEDIAGLKWADGNLGMRPLMDLPYVSALLMLVDAPTLQFIGVMDSAHITNLRTGAQSAVASCYLTKKRNITLGLYGAGMQGHTQTMAFAERFTLNKVVVYDVFPAASEKYKADCAHLVKDGNIVIAKTPEEVCKDADIIICVTQSKDKYVKDEWIGSGQILFPMGSYQECEDKFIKNADKIIVDHIEQCMHRGALSGLHEKGELKEIDVYATIGEVVANKKSVVPVEESHERILCLPIGTGSMDVAVGGIVLERAKEKGVGGKYEFV